MLQSVVVGEHGIGYLNSGRKDGGWGGGGHLFRNLYSRGKKRNRKTFQSVTCFFYGN